MIYHSVAEIFEAINASHDRFSQRVQELNEAQVARRSESGQWSIADITEHLAIIDEQVLMLVSKLLARAEAEVKAISDAAIFPINPVSLQQQLEQARTQKFQSPEASCPRGGISITDSLARIEVSRAKLNALRPRLERIDLSNTSFPHPFFGKLDLYQWLAFLPAHQERHLRQIERLMNAPEL